MNNNVQIIVAGITIQDLEVYVKSLVKKVMKDGLNMSFVHQQSSPVESELLTRKQVAKLLGISLPTLDARIKGESLPYSRIGKKILFEKHKVLENIVKNGGGK